MIEVWHAIGGQYVRAGRAGFGDPIPTGLAATPGNAQVSLTWTAPAPATGVTDYAVQYKPASSSTWSTFADAVSTTPSATVTGLTNGTAYDLRVAAVRSGVVGTYTAPVRSTPRVVAATPTIFGYNTNEKDTFNQTLAGRQAWWSGRAPCVRRYLSSFFDADTFPVAQSRWPEKRISLSFKADGSGSYTKSGLAAGNGNDRITAICEDLPVNATLWLTYYHESNDELRPQRDTQGVLHPAELTVDQYQNAYAQFRTAIDAASLRSGVKVFLTPNFMAYKLTSTGDGTATQGEFIFFNDAWVPPVGVADLLTFDVYGNPGQFTTPVTGQGYGTSYPNVNRRWADTFAAIERNGFASHWGVLENNTPARDWDTDPIPESVRAQWLIDNTELALHPPMTGSVPPEIFLYWEAVSGANWHQQFGRLAGSSPLTCANAIAPYILNTPVGG